jgi:hypothetical protein
VYVGIAKIFSKQSDIDKYKKQRNKVSNLKKTAKEHFEQNLDTLIIENISNPKTYWKIMKMLIKSNKGYSNIPSSLLNHGLSLLRIVTILAGMHSLATLRNELQVSQCVLKQE